MTNQSKSISELIDKDQYFNWDQFFNQCNELQTTVVFVYSFSQQRYIYCNRAYNKLFGYAPVNLLIGNISFWKSLIHSDDLVNIETKLFELREMEAQSINSINFTYRISCDDGQYIVINQDQKYFEFQRKGFVISLINNVTENHSICQYLNECVNIKSGDKETRSTVEPSISKRELEVLKLIGTGMSSKEIADSLCISNHTAISHRKNLIEKFRVKNTAQLIREASRIIWMD